MMINGTKTITLISYIMFIYEYIKQMYINNIYLYMYYIQRNGITRANI